MKILVIGSWISNIHEQPVMDALLSLGHQITKYSWSEFIFNQQNATPLRNFWAKIQNKYILGNIISDLNKDLIRTAAAGQFDLIFIYRGTHLFKNSLLTIKKTSPDTIIVGYNNDNPYTKGHPFYLWRHFIRCLPLYDVACAYRQVNMKDFEASGAHDTYLLKPWYVPKYHYPIDLTLDDRKKYSCDVVFIGHYENDNRAKIISDLSDSGINIKIFGPMESKYSGWSTALTEYPHLAKLLPTKMLWGDDYIKALCGSKIALCFLSKLNADTYTRRCFEIPATRTMMISERTADLSNIFPEGEAAEYFSTPEECISKVKKYLREDKKRLEIAQNGYRIVQTEGHDVKSRMTDLLQHVTKIADNNIPPTNGVQSAKESAHYRDYRSRRVLFGRTSFSKKL